MLVIGEADDPRQAPARSERVPARETVESEHVQPTFGEVVGGGASVRPQTDDDRVVDVLSHARLSVREGPKSPLARLPRNGHT